MHLPEMFHYANRHDRANQPPEKTGGHRRRGGWRHCHRNPGWHNGWDNADADPDAHANTDTHADTNADPNAYSDSDTYSDTYSDTNADTNANPDANTNSDADSWQSVADRVQHLRQRPADWIG